MEVGQAISFVCFSSLLGICCLAWAHLGPGWVPGSCRGLSNLTGGEQRLPGCTDKPIQAWDSGSSNNVPALLAGPKGQWLSLQLCPAGSSL